MKVFLIVSLIVVLFVSCRQSPEEAISGSESGTLTFDNLPDPGDISERQQAQNSPVTSQATLEKVKAALENDYDQKGSARIGLLYFLDRPAHREAIVNWLTASGAKIKFENSQFGYLDAELSWQNLS